MGEVVREKGTGEIAGSGLPGSFQPADFVLGRCGAGRPVSGVAGREVGQPVLPAVSGAVRSKARRQPARPAVLHYALVLAGWARERMASAIAAATSVPSRASVLRLMMSPGPKQAQSMARPLLYAITITVKNAPSRTEAAMAA